MANLDASIEGKVESGDAAVAGNEEISCSKDTVDCLKSLTVTIRRFHSERRSRPVVGEMAIFRQNRSLVGKVWHWL
jgi:hypothetical protein